MVSKVDRSHSSFTLVELLVVIAIIIVLMGIILVVAVGSRARARSASCMNQMHQIGLALGTTADHGISRNWASASERWTGRSGLLLCPEGPQDGATNYAVNTYLQRGLSGVRDSGSVLLLYESTRAGSNLFGDESDIDWRHMEGSNFVFLDGHAVWSKEAPDFALNH
jgi:prepilin-type processing-associated H-X9-DG protein